MLRLSKKMLFAIEAVLDIAYNAGALPVQSGEITRRQGIPRRYLEQVLQQLVRARRPDPQLLLCLHRDRLSLQRRGRPLLLGGLQPREPLLGPAAVSAPLLTSPPHS